MRKEFYGLHPSYEEKYTCEECGQEATYQEFILAEGYPDAHTERQMFCPHCGDNESSLDD